MAKYNVKRTAPAPTVPADFSFLQKVIPLVTGWLVLLVSIAFFTGTYDSAHVKLTLFQTGAVMLGALWGAKLLLARKNPFTRANLPFFLPLLAYMAWQTFSFVCFPYKTAAAEEFTRQWLYTLITLMMACEFTQNNVRTLSRFIVAAAWISFLYGAVQIAAIWFPALDIMNWRGFFGNRIFSTHANPNFFGAFIVFSSCIAGAQYLITRQKKLLVLLGLGLAALAFTETKGAWLAYGASAAVFALGYLHSFATPAAKKRITAAAAVLVGCALIGAGIYGAKRFQSVSFRAYTWLSVFEMVQDSPIKGTGLGSFKVTYPAYRRPQIFYLENAHNTETQHAENEYLEQWAVGGTVGLALFLWMMVFFAVLAWKNLTSPLTEKPDPRERERRFFFLGYGTALAGLLVHAAVDISVHFASSGLLMAAFMGVLLALGMNRTEEKIPAAISPAHPKILGCAKIAGYLCCAGMLAYIFTQFALLMLTLTRTRFGDWVMAMAAWLTLMACLSGANYVYMRTIYLTKKIAVVAILVLSLPFIIFTYNVFQANHYYSVGVALINLRNAEGALGYFTKAIRLNPFQLEYRQYRASVLATTLNLNNNFSPARGDKNAPSNDYERALKDYQYVLLRHPNHALLHQSIAQLYYAVGVKYVQASYQSRSAQEQLLYNDLSRENLEHAKRALKMALDLDPVNPTTYQMLAGIALMEHRFDDAQYWIDQYKKGPAGVTETAFLSRHADNAQIALLQEQINRLRPAAAENKAQRK